MHFSTIFPTYSIVVNFSSGGNVIVKMFKILSSIFHPIHGGEVQLITEHVVTVVIGKLFFFLIFFTIIFFRLRCLLYPQSTLYQTHQRDGESRIYIRSDQSRSHRAVNVAQTHSRKWILKPDWTIYGKECGSIISSQLWDEALHDNSRNGCKHGKADCTRSEVKKKVPHIHFINRVNTLFFV